MSKIQMPLMCILQLIQHSTILWMDRTTKTIFKLGAMIKTLPRQQHILTSRLQWQLQRAHPWACIQGWDATIKLIKILKLTIDYCKKPLLFLADRIQWLKLSLHLMIVIISPNRYCLQISTSKLLSVYQASKICSVLIVLFEHLARWHVSVRKHKTS